MTQTTLTQDFTPQGDRVRSMFASISKRYDLLNTVLSGGIHHLWKRKLIQGVPSGEAILDLCTGTGDLLPLLKSKTQDLVGADFCPEMIDAGGRRGEFTMVEADAMNLHFAHESFSAVTVAFGVRNFEDLRRGLSQIRRVLKPAGTIHILEFGQPTLWGWRTVYNWYSTVVLPKLGAMISGNSYAYKYLPQTSANFPSGKEFAEILESQGFSEITSTPLMGGIAYIYHGVKA